LKTSGGGTETLPLLGNKCHKSSQGRFKEEKVKTEIATIADANRMGR